MASLDKLDPRPYIQNIVDFIQWALIAIGLTLMLALFAGSMLAKFGFAVRFLPTAAPLELMYYGIAWTCVSGLFATITRSITGR